MKITHNRLDYDRRYNDHTMHVYISDTALHKLADKFYKQHNIGEMRVKSRAWNKVTKRLHDMISPLLAKFFSVPVENVKWNAKCGCSCGCSPGYRIRIGDPNMQRRNIHMAEIEVDDSAIQRFNDLLTSYSVIKALHSDMDKHMSVVRNTVVYD